MTQDGFDAIVRLFSYFKKGSGYAPSNDRAAVTEVRIAVNPRPYSQKLQIKDATGD